MGSNTIIAIVVGAVLVIVGFSLWPVLNGASNSLYSYFRDSCDDGSGNRFLQAYYGASDGAALTTPDPNAYYAVGDLHGGRGVRLSGNSSSECEAAGVVPASVPGGVPFQIFNEQGDLIGSKIAPAGSSTSDFSTTADDAYHWVEVAPMLQRFAGINNLLLTVLPVVSIAGFLGISGAKLYSYGKGTASIGSSISTSVFTLIGIVVAMVIAGPIMGSAVDANQFVVSGQYQVNSTFGNIIQLLFSMIPVIYIAGLVTLVGLQARSALMGGSRSMY